MPPGRQVKVVMKIRNIKLPILPVAVKLMIGYAARVEELMSLP